MRLTSDGSLATIEDQTDALRAVRYDDPLVELLHIRAREAEHNGIVPYSRDIRDWMAASGTAQIQATGHIDGETEIEQQREDRHSDDGRKQTQQATAEIGDTAETEQQTEDKKPDDRESQGQQATKKTAGKDSETTRQGKGRKSAKELEHEANVREAAAAGHYPACEFHVGDKR